MFFKPTMHHNMFILFITLILVAFLPPFVQGEEVDTYKKGPWTPTEDGVLVRYIEKHGPRNWNAVSKYSGLNRCGKSCRLRWTNHLRPDLKKGSFTQEEEEKIIRLHEQFGNKWARIAKQLAGRTDNEIKNYWNTKIKRQQRLKNNVNQPVPSSSTTTTTNDDTNTPWPVTQPLLPTCYNPPGPSPVTVSRGYPLMVRPLQVDTSACRIDTPSHQYPTLLASYGNSQPHLQRNQLPFTEVMPSSCNNFLPCDNYSSLRAALKSKAVAAEYDHLKGDMMSTVAGPMIPIQDPRSTQHNMGVTIQRHQQQQEEERRLIEQLQQRRHIQQWQQQLQQQQQQQKQDEERQQHQQHNSRPMPTALCTDNDFII